MTGKIRTSVTLTMSRIQKETMDLVCSFEKRSLTQQVDYVMKRYLQQWTKKNMNEAVEYYGKNNVLKKIAGDPSLLMK